MVTGWALRGRRWRGAAAAIGVAIVGMVAAMYGVNALLLVSSTPQATAADGRWTLGVGLVAVGAASIATIGLPSSAWEWLTSPTGRRAAADSLWQLMRSGS